MYENIGFKVWRNNSIMITKETDIIINQLIPSIRVGPYRAFYIERQIGEQIEISIKLNNFENVRMKMKDSKDISGRGYNYEEVKEFGGSYVSLHAYYGAIVTSQVKINSLEVSISSIKNQIVIKLYTRFIQELTENAIRFLELLPDQEGAQTQGLSNDNRERDHYLERRNSHSVRSESQKE